MKTQNSTVVTLHTGTTTSVRRAPSRQQRGITGHIATLLACGLLTAVAMPFTPHLWPGWVASLIAATAMLSVRRKQPRIDDREVDWILAVLALGCCVWVLRQWPGTGHDLADTVAWLLGTTACLLLVSGTRAMSWIWPAAVPALVWLLPYGWFLLPLVLAVLAIGFFAVLNRRGFAPADQLITMPVVRLIVVVVALAIVAFAARWGVAA